MNLERHLDWLAAWTDWLLRAIDEFARPGFDQATGLPGWTAGHVVAHLHHNAEALGRLVDWAATGVPNPMYAGPEQRDAEIEESARLPADELQTLVRRSATALESAMAGLPQQAWSATVETAQGRLITAAEIPWLRLREIVVHAVDLGVGEFADYPEEFLNALAREVFERRLGRGEAAPLAAWLTGRDGGAVLPAWL